jgi:protein-S-isoprenylcysteine O-methyltransferase Ste14
MEKLSPLGIGPKIGRIAIPYVAIGITLTILYPHIFSFGPIVKKPFLIAGIIILVIFLACYFATIRSLLKGLRNNRLMTTGTFGICQNPLYACMILLLIPGLALALNSWIVLTNVVVAYIIFKKFIHIEYEEMEKIFGEEYLKYKNRTPEFFPFLRKRGI